MWRRDSCMKGWLSILMFGAMIVALCSTPAAAQKQPESKNMELVGYSDLQGRSSYQPVVHKQGNRWIAYIGLAIILYVACEMIYRGAYELKPVIG